MPIFLVLLNFTSAQHGVSVKFIRWGMRKKVVHRIAFRCQNGSSAQQSHALSSSSSLCWMKRFFRECFCLLLSFMGVVVAINQTHVHSHSLTYSLLPLYPSKTNTHTHTHLHTHTRTLLHSRSHTCVHALHSERWKWRRYYPLWGISLKTFNRKRTNELSELYAWICWSYAAEKNKRNSSCKTFFFSLQISL